LLTLIEGEPDLTLDEVVCAMRSKLSGSRTAVWRFFQRHKITFKKTSGTPAARFRRGARRARWARTR
jgi:transposase